MATNQTARERLAAQLRAQYNTGQAGSGSWDDAGEDRSLEMADLLLLNGIDDISGGLSFVDTTQKTQVQKPLSEWKDLRVEEMYGGSADNPQTTQRYFDKDGNEVVVQVGEDGVAYGTGIGEVPARQLKIGDKVVGYLGDYNNDGSYGSKRGDYLQGRGDEALLGWSSRGKGNTSYRVVEDPETGKLVIAPGWNSSSDASTVRKAAIATAGMLAAGYGAAALAGMGAGAGAGAGAAAAGTGAGAGATTLGLTGAQWGAVGTGALKGAAIGAGTNTVRQLASNGWDLDEVDAKGVLKAGAIGGAAGGLASGVGAYTGSGTAGQVAGGAARTALNGGSGEDILKGALVSGASGMANDYMKADLGLDASTRGALIGGGRALVNGGDARDVLFGAGSGYLNASDRPGSVTRNDTGPATTDTGAATTEGSSTMMDDEYNWNTGGFGDMLNSNDMTLDYGDVDMGTGDPIADAYNDPSRDLDTLSNNEMPDDTDPAFMDYFKGAMSWLFSSGSNGGKGTWSSGSNWLRDLMPLIGAGVNGMNIEKAKKDERDWIEKQAADKRRRQAPLGALPRLTYNVNRGSTGGAG